MPVHSLLIKPAGPDCNLKCGYCFYARTEAQFSHGTHRMPVQVLEKMLQSYVPRAASGVHIGFQGGEPTLMGLGFYREAYRLMQSLKPSRAPLSWAMQTNGMLIDDEWAAFAAETSLLLGVSLDGSRELHETMRPGSYDHVRKTLKTLNARGAQFNTLTVVSSTNVNHVSTVWDALLDAGSTYLQFIPCLNSIFSPEPMAWADFLIEAFERWQKEWPRIYVRNFDEMLAAFAHYREMGCQTSPQCALNLVVEHDGGVYPCDFFVDPSRKLGNVMNDDIYTLSERPEAAAFVNGKASVDNECSACRWRGMCHGHCPAYCNNGKSVLCEGLKRFFAFAQPRLLEMKRSLIEKGRLRDDLARIERNAPCPCGSGKKFKQCCWVIKRV